MQIFVSCAALEDIAKALQDILGIELIENENDMDVNNTEEINHVGWRFLVGLKLNSFFAEFIDDLDGEVDLQINIESFLSTENAKGALVLLKSERWHNAGYFRYVRAVSIEGSKIIVRNDIEKLLKGSALPEEKGGKYALYYARESPTFVTGSAKDCNGNYKKGLVILPDKVPFISYTNEQGAYAFPQPKKYPVNIIIEDEEENCAAEVTTVIRENAPSNEEEPGNEPTTGDEGEIVQEVPEITLEKNPEPKGSINDDGELTDVDYNFDKTGINSCGKGWRLYRYLQNTTVEYIDGVKTTLINGTTAVNYKTSEEIQSEPEVKGRYSFCQDQSSQRDELFNTAFTKNGFDNDKNVLFLATDFVDENSDDDKYVGYKACVRINVPTKAYWVGVQFDVFVTKLASFNTISYKISLPGSKQEISGSADSNREMTWEEIGSKNLDWMASDIVFNLIFPEGRKDGYDKFIYHLKEEPISPAVGNTLLTSQGSQTKGPGYCGIPKSKNGVNGEIFIQIDDYSRGKESEICVSIQNDPGVSSYDDSYGGIIVDYLVFLDEDGKAIPVED